MKIKSLNSNDNLELYIDLIKKFDNNINIKNSKNYFEITYNNNNYKINSKKDFIEFFKNVIDLKNSNNINELFLKCNNLVNFIIYNSKYKDVIDLIIPNNQEFKNLFLLAIHIDNSDNIFNELNKNQIKSINIQNINIILSNFIIYNNNAKLDEINNLETVKIDLEDKIQNLQTKINELTAEKIKKENQMYEKNSVMWFYDEYKTILENIEKINTKIKKQDKNKMNTEIENINYQKEIDNILYKKRKLDNNFILKFIKRKTVSSYEEEIQKFNENINDNLINIKGYKNQNQNLKNTKQQLILEFCSNYNKQMMDINKEEFSFNDIKNQFQKIKEFNEFKNQFELDGLIARRNELKSKLLKISDQTKYKNKFYLIYQIKNVCDIMQIPIEEVLNKDLLQIVSTKNVSKVA